MDEIKEKANQVFGSPVAKNCKRVERGENRGKYIRDQANGRTRVDISVGFQL